VRDDPTPARRRAHRRRARHAAGAWILTTLLGTHCDRSDRLGPDGHAVNPVRRWLEPGTPAQHRADLVRSVSVARVVVVLAAVAAVVTAAALGLRGRQLDAAVVGLAGVTTAFVADALLRWVGWQAQRSIEDEPG
jgi:hypothetical protein